MAADHLEARALWDYSRHLYGLDGVADACLGLQDHYGLDVNLLLFACWRASCGHAIAPEAMMRVVAAARPWQNGVLVPVREVRRRLKTSRDLFVHPQAERLRHELGAIELTMERAEQIAILSAVAGDPGPLTDSPDRWRRNVDTYLASAALMLDGAGEARLDLVIDSAVRCA